MLISGYYLIYSSELYATESFTNGLSNNKSAHWAKLAQEIEQHITDAEKLYLEGNPKEAKKSIVKAYFGVFEDKKMEAAMRVTLGQKHTHLVERQFSKLRKAIDQSNLPSEIKSIASELRNDILQAAKILDEKQIPKEVFTVQQ